MPQLKNIQFHLLFKDIRFWIVLFFILRLFNIDSPLFDSHNWRQADGYSIARNFFEIDSNILYPRIDHAGNLTGIMGSEFPIMNYLVYWTYCIFGVDWWQGRLLNLLVSSIGCYFFYQLLYKFIKKEIAFSATLFLIASLWFSHSRKFMPDVFSCSLVIIGIYFGWKFLKYRSNWSVLVYFLFITIGLLSKLPSFVLVALLAPALFDKSIVIKRKLFFVLFSILALLPSIWWYFIWAPYLTAEFGYYYFFMGTDIKTSFGFLVSEWPNTLSKFYEDAVHIVGFILYLFGIVLAIFKRNRALVLILLFGCILQIIFMLKAGYAFTHHSYYIIPFIPIMVIFSAFAISLVKKNWIKITLISLVVLEGIIALQHDFRIKESNLYKLKLEALADKYSKRNDLIILNDAMNPAGLYFAHRKGWTVDSGVVNDEALMRSYKDRGAKIFIWNKNMSAAPSAIPCFRFLEENDDFMLYKVVE